jgi:hypothetical protein
MDVNQRATHEWLTLPVANVYAVANGGIATRVQRASATAKADETSASSRKVTAQTKMSPARARGARSDASRLATGTLVELYTGRRKLEPVPKKSGTSSRSKPKESRNG